MYNIRRFLLFRIFLWKLTATQKPKKVERCLRNWANTKKKVYLSKRNKQFVFCQCLRNRTNILTPKKTFISQYICNAKSIFIDFPVRLIKLVNMFLLCTAKSIFIDFFRISMSVASGYIRIFKPLRLIKLVFFYFFLSFIFKPVSLIKLFFFYLVYFYF